MTTNQLPCRDITKSCSAKFRFGSDTAEFKMGKSEAKAFVNGQISSHKIVVFSKTYCPFCKMAKQALKDVGAEFFTIELETRDDGSDIQDFLLELTGGRSVGCCMLFAGNILSKPKRLHFLNRNESIWGKNGNQCKETTMHNHCIILSRAETNSLSTFMT